MTKQIFTLNKSPIWQLEREAHIADRKHRITIKYIDDPQARFRIIEPRGRPTQEEMEEEFPILYEYMNEVVYAEAEAYLMSIQEDEVEF